MTGARILVVDDEPQIRRVLKSALSAHGYEVHDARTGEEALESFRARRFDLVLLDVNMPGIGGLETCRQIRQSSDAAIIMLTVRDAEADKVAALDAGADDYVTKPFGAPELMARIRAALRRVPAPASASGRIRVGNLAIDFGARSVRRGGTAAHLTPKELDLLRYLTQHPNQAVTHRELLQAIWGPDYGDQVDYLRAIVKNLRKKIEANPEDPQYVLTEPWVGYRFNGAPEPE
jgi:two-component system KDP operon response regulator KdpE